jgi:hypothetical protein
VAGPGSDLSEEPVWGCEPVALECRRSPVSSRARHCAHRVVDHVPVDAVWDQVEQPWISDAELAEVPFTAFTSRRKAEHLTARLLVHRAVWWDARRGQHVQMSMSPRTWSASFNRFSGCARRWARATGSDEPAARCTLWR